MRACIVLDGKANELNNVYPSYYSFCEEKACNTYMVGNPVGGEQDNDCVNLDAIIERYISCEFFYVIASLQRTISDARYGDCDGICDVHRTVSWINRQFTALFQFFKCNVFGNDYWSGSGVLFWETFSCCGRIGGFFSRYHGRNDGGDDGGNASSFLLRFYDQNDVNHSARCLFVVNGDF